MSNATEPHAETLRRVAQEILTDWSSSPDAGQEATHHYHLGVAAWLFRAADFATPPKSGAAWTGRPKDLEIALAVAAAYPGGP